MDIFLFEVEYIEENTGPLPHHMLHQAHPFLHVFYQLAVDVASVVDRHRFDADPDPIFHDPDPNTVPD